MNRKERRARQKAGGAKAAALLNQGLQQHQTGNLAQAAALYREVLTIAPDNADALNLLGLTCHQRDDHDQARELIGKAIRLAPSVPLYHNNLAMALLGADDCRAAIGSLRHAVALDASYVDGWVNLGDALDRDAQYGEALTAYRTALRLAPDAAFLHFQLAKCLAETGDRTAAIAALRRAVALEPRFADAYERLGFLLREEDQPEAALEMLQKALDIEPDDAKAWYTTGLARQDLDQPDEALAAYDRAIALEPDLVEAHHNRGAMLHEIGRDDEALAAYDRALALDPELHDARTDRSLILLAAGRFAEGWRDYRARRSIADVRERLDREPLPRDLAGKRLLVMRDQGLGDEIFFLRFVPALKERGATVIYRGQHPLVRIVRRLDFLDAVLDETRDEAPGDVDMWLSAGDLPGLLAMQSENDIPPSVRLSVPPADAARARDALHRLGPPPYIGLTWRAGIQKRNRLSKIAPLEGLARGLAGIEASFIALQRLPQPGEISRFADMLGRPVHDMTDLNDDLEAMLAVLDGLDDYVCVSNTNTHLRAGLGKPSHVLVPHPADYRWMRSGDRSPWFPGAKLYRETLADGWVTALAALAADFRTARPPR